LLYQTVIWYKLYTHLCTYILHSNLTYNVQKWKTAPNDVQEYDMNLQGENGMPNSKCCRKYNDVNI